MKKWNLKKKERKQGNEQDKEKVVSAFNDYRWPKKLETENIHGGWGRYLWCILNRAPVGISTARVAIRVADYRSVIAIHVTTMIFGRDFKDAREIIRGIFWSMAIKYSYGQTPLNLPRLLFNETAINNGETYQIFHTGDVYASMHKPFW